MDPHPADAGQPSRPPRPSIAELRSVCQPPATLNRVNAEHWAGRLYMRQISIYVTRVLLRLGVSADTVTSIMVVVGVLGGLALLLPGLPGAIAAVVLIQVYLLLDCCDGEVARWRGTSSVRGVYLDRVGHYLTEATLLAALGFRAAGLGANVWTVIGLLAAIFALLIKAETDLVDAARARGGLDVAPESAGELTGARIARARRLAASLRIHRITGAVEASLLICLASIVDSLRGNLIATRVLTTAVMVIAGVQVILHLISILKSRRLV
jgi:phosphatidylglycerophosphate synthase